ncbi:MAG TPA: DMT family transporter [Burkholderiales bacterium]|nr:DMT family transporter [Burkholderiales bacterium]
MSAESRWFRPLGLFLAGAGSILFSTRSILIKLAYAYHVDPITFLALRMVFSLPFFIAAGIWAQKSRQTPPVPLSRRDIAAIIGLGLLGYYFASYVDFVALQYISAALARLILFLNPTITLIVMALFFSRRIIGREVAAMLACYAGIALCLLHDVQLSGSVAETTLGSLLSFTSAVCYALYLIFSNKLIARIGSVPFTAYAMTVSCIAVIVHFLIVHPLSALDLPWQVYAYGAGMAVFCTALPVFMVSEANRRIGPAHVGILGSMGPLATVLLGMVVLNETVSASQFAGMLLVLVGVWFVSQKPRSA